MAIGAHELLHQSKSVEWFTPAEYVEAARRVMGGIDVDPASCAQANAVVKARRYFTIRDDGLAQDWPGRVWLNPPYGRVAGKSSAAVWSERLVAQYRAGVTVEAVLLVNASVGDGWFMRLFDWPMCFAERRIRFCDTQGRPAMQPTKGNAFVYLGDNVDRFLAEFGCFGVLIRPAGPAQSPIGFPGCVSWASGQNGRE